MDILSRKLLHEIQFYKFDNIACTFGPGLIGSLVVGSSFAKGLGLSWNKDVISVNHLQAHLLSPRLTSKLKFPYLCLLVSGGNTALVLVENPFKFKVLGSTIDDSAGECFDKVAKSLNFSYPGGPKIEKFAMFGDNKKYILPIPMKDKKNFNFSFSGLKTAAIKIIKNNKLSKTFINNFCASFQETISEVLALKTENAIKYLKKNKVLIKDFSICGGVAANHQINNHLRETVKRYDLNFHQVPLNLCTDNAAMVAWAAIEQNNLGITKNKISLRPSPSFRINETL